MIENGMRASSIQTDMDQRQVHAPRVAVLIPCFNEEVAIGRVVDDFRQHLPESTIYVYDNNSSDRTAEAAGEAGAVVRTERRQGKGNVVRRMFSDVEADVYLLVDGDGTYDAASAPSLMYKLLSERLDMVVGARRDAGTDGLYRRGHRFGNRLFTRSVTMLFGRDFTDILSGYRCFSRRFVKSFPALSEGFDIETELAVHSLNLVLPSAEIATPYGSRPEGSHSKLGTLRDGWRILVRILVLLKELRPFIFFAVIASFLAILSVALGIPVIWEYLETGLVPRFPTAILSTGIMILAFLLFTAGMILDSISRMRREMKRLSYLAIQGPLWQRGGWVRCGDGDPLEGHRQSVLPAPEIDGMEARVSVPG
jgi:glycosyltransferase involved in cell wall biosynthesis